MTHRVFLVVCMLLPIAPECPAQTQVGTAFSYQGELRQSGSPVNGTADLRFRLYTAETNGTQVGSEIAVNNAALAQGRFTSSLDFGAAAFGPDARWLEIDMRSPAGAGAFVTLAPRQRITPAPVARFAVEAETAAAAAVAIDATQFNGQPATFYQNAANLSSGTLPSARLAGTYSGALNFTNAGNVFAGSGAGLSGVNADLLDGLNSTAFLQSIPVPLSLGGSLASPIIFGQNASSANDATGAEGRATAPSGVTYGVRGSSASPSGYGVYGENPDNVGVFGRATAASGINYGVYGQTASSGGIAVRGDATALTGNAIGVWGSSDSTSGRGVYGYATADSGTTRGVWGIVDSPTGAGVYGYGNAATGGCFGVQGVTESVVGTGVYGVATAVTGPSRGVKGESASTDGFGVTGHATAATGFGIGGYFEAASPNGTGVVGLAPSTTGNTEGGFFQSQSATGKGVVGNATSGGATATPYGVWGFAATSTLGYGVFASGDLGATGVKSFRIDHPADPENKYLLHYAAESPEVINFYRGNVLLDGAGGAIIELPAYFAGINKDPSYILTAVGAPMPMLHIAEPISEALLAAGERAEPGVGPPLCTFRIAGGAPGGRVSWEVKALRNDLRVRLHGAPVERDKVGPERGKYQRPEYYGQPAERGMESTPHVPSRNGVTP